MTEGKIRAVLALAERELSPFDASRCGRLRPDLENTVALCQFALEAIELAAWDPAKFSRAGCDCLSCQSRRFLDRHGIVVTGGDQLHRTKDKEPPCAT